MSENFKALSTILAQCKQGEHDDCPSSFNSLVSGRIIRCICKCHIGQKVTDKKGGENVK